MRASVSLICIWLKVNKFKGNSILTVQKEQRKILINMNDNLVFYTFHLYEQSILYEQKMKIIFCYENTFHICNCHLQQHITREFPDLGSFIGCWELS